MNRLLHTLGKGKFIEEHFALPALPANKILVRSVMTGVCRSDIDMMEGNFGPLPIEMSGHEGLGIVEQVGSDITNVRVGDYVATRGEPAYADYYHCQDYVQVPELHSRYIIEPVACAINIIIQEQTLLGKKRGRMLIMGSGMLSWVVYNAIQILDYNFDITIVGSHNKEVWGDKLSTSYEGKFDVVIDLGSKDLFNQDIYNPGALYYYAAQKETTSDLRYLLWNAGTIVCPSPRASTFHRAMILARDWIKNGDLNVDAFWTKGYDRDTEWQQAFEDGVNRPANYSRGYIKWSI
jgi:D-arabinose 1-dehydrogenase-like Zn-dependent alcohol dehydrogenase